MKQVQRQETSQGTTVRAMLDTNETFVLGRAVQMGLQDEPERLDEQLTTVTNLARSFGEATLVWDGNGGEFLNFLPPFLDRYAESANNASLQMAANGVEEVCFSLPPLEAQARIAQGLANQIRLQVFFDRFMGKDLSEV